MKYDGVQEETTIIPELIQKSADKRIVVVCGSMQMAKKV